MQTCAEHKTHRVLGLIPVWMQPKCY